MLSLFKTMLQMLFVIVTLCLSTGCSCSCAGWCISESVFETNCESCLSDDATVCSNKCGNFMWKCYCSEFFSNPCVWWRSYFSHLCSSCFWLFLWLRFCKIDWARFVIITNHIHSGWHEGIKFMSLLITSQVNEK